MLSPEEAATLNNPMPRRAPRWTLCRLAVCLAVLAGCHGRPPQTPPPPVDPLAVAHRHFEEGEFAAALAAYEAYLDDAGEAAAGEPARALVLFRLAMIRLMPEPAVQDWNAARRLFERLIETHPESPLAAEAEVVLHLQREVERLYGQLEALKRIDLGGETPPRPRRP